VKINSPTQKQPPIIDNELSDIRIIDINPLDLGISCKGDIMSVIIKRGTRIPCTVKLRFHLIYI